MPWRPADATKHQKAASDAGLRRLWASVANNVLKSTGDEGLAVRTANARVNAAITRRKAKGKG